MRKFIPLAAAAALSLSITACSEPAGPTATASTIAGTWVGDTDSFEFENALNSFMITDGQFSCESCNPPYTIPADGEWHEVAQPGWADSLRMSVVDDSTLEGARRLGGVDQGNATWSLSDDGQSLTIAWNDISGEAPVSGTTSFTRNEAGPEGSHPISGKWTPTEIENTSDTGRETTYTLDGDTITAVFNSGSYTATLGGEPVTIEGDKAGGLLSVEKTGENSYRETYTLDGEVINILELTVEGDTLSYVSKYQPDGSVTRWRATRK